LTGAEPQTSLGAEVKSGQVLGGAYSAPFPRPLTGFKGPTSKRREGREGRKRNILTYSVTSN